MTEDKLLLFLIEEVVYRLLRLRCLTAAARFFSLNCFPATASVGVTDDSDDLSSQVLILLTNWIAIPRFTPLSVRDLASASWAEKSRSRSRPSSNAILQASR